MSTKKRARLANADAEDVIKLVADASVDLVLADPPYDISVSNVKWDKLKDHMGFR